MPFPPTPRLEALLNGPGRWCRLEHLHETPSTNTVVVQRAHRGAPAGLVVVADRQTAGRGRRGRRWEDRPGGSLLTSVLVDVAGAQAGLLPFAAGLAVADAIAAAGASPRLKWPNDVLLDDRKCAGILIEAVPGPTGELRFVVGVGVNVDWRGTPRDGEAARWVSIAEATRRPVDRWGLLADLLESFDRWLEEPPSTLRPAFRQRCATIGSRVRVTLADRVVVAEAVDVDDSGGLVLRTAETTVTVRAGDVEHLRREDSPGGTQ
ncbi:MAG: biotin--[acetyl-CoA-carboxylase] ligase [Actinobacteria bacterium]|nr:biotin--[acetyl-CoA-carboxylase] ligase [Actinomycetota bacterium]